MTVSTITPTPTPHGAHHAHSHGRSGSATRSSSGTQTTAGESLQQRAEQGDPIAIAELRAERPQTGSAGHRAVQLGSPQQGGAVEPGKGEQFDRYA